MNTYLFTPVDDCLPLEEVVEVHERLVVARCDLLLERDELDVIIHDFIDLVDVLVLLLVVRVALKLTEVLF